MREEEDEGLHFLIETPTAQHSLRAALRAALALLVVLLSVLLSVLLFVLLSHAARRAAREAVKLLSVLLFTSLVVLRFTPLAVLLFVLPPVVAQLVVLLIVHAARRAALHATLHAPRRPGLLLFVAALHRENERGLVATASSGCRTGCRPCAAAGRRAWCPVRRGDRIVVRLSSQRASRCASGLECANARVLLSRGRGNE